MGISCGDESNQEGKKMGYTLIKRAKKNVGDFLIWERAKELLEKHTKSTTSSCLKDGKLLTIVWQKLIKRKQL